MLPSSTGCWGSRIIIGKEKGGILENCAIPKYDKKISFSQVVEDKGSFMIVVFMTISINFLFYQRIWMSCPFWS